jgi:hypothetical protein
MMNGNRRAGQARNQMLSIEIHEECNAITVKANLVSHVEHRSAEKMHVLSQSAFNITKTISHIPIILRLGSHSDTGGVS